jgi:hypothetical protein
MIGRLIAGSLSIYLPARIAPLSEGQTNPIATAPIATDRPAITNSSVVVPSGSLQIENGFQVTTVSGQRAFEGPESLVWARLDGCDGVAVYGCGLGRRDWLAITEVHISLYFLCICSGYRAKASIRMRPRSSSLSAREKNGPHTGI